MAASALRRGVDGGLHSFVRVRLVRNQRDQERGGGLAAGEIIANPFSQGMVASGIGDADHGPDVISDCEKKRDLFWHESGSRIKPAWLSRRRQSLQMLRP